MKYVIRGYTEDDIIRYGVYDNQEQDEINHVPHQGLILLLDELDDAVVVCKILNKEDNSNMNKYNDGVYKLGDIVEFVKEKPYEMGVIECSMGGYYMVNMVDKKGNLTGHKYLMHKNEIRHKNW